MMGVGGEGAGVQNSCIPNLPNDVGGVLYTDLRPKIGQNHFFCKINGVRGMNLNFIISTVS